MAQFEDIRPYNDQEVRPVIAELINDNEFIDAITALSLPRIGRYIAPLVRPLVRKKITAKTADIQTVADLQKKAKFYLGREIDRTITGLTITGLDKLDPQSSYLFVSNHRDIAMDPALVNWSLFSNGFSTLRVAIGDNLLTKPFASHLMRLNKSFIVKRSATSTREKFKAAKTLSHYIMHSLNTDNENIWIAQREGRAKDGIDVSNQAILSMFALSKAKSETFGEFIAKLRIVPVTIAYEYDPCDAAKAQELYAIEQTGSYQKGEQEDVQSIARGLTGFKGNVHVHFGEPLTTHYDDAEQVKHVLDVAMLDNYILQPSNCIAYELLEKVSPKVNVGASQMCFTAQDYARERAMFSDRLDTIPQEMQHTFLRGYANVVYRKLKELA